MILNIISTMKGGGAEVLVNELHKIYLKRKLDSHVIYFSGEIKEIGKNYSTLGLNPRNPLIIFSLRKIIKKFLSKSKEDLIIHVHLTWPFFYVVLAVMGLKKIKLFFTVHGKDRRRKIPFFWILEKFFYSRYTRVICISNTVLKSLLDWLRLKNSKKIIKIYNGSRIFNLAERKSLENNLPKLISIGSLNYTKNFSTTILAVSKIRHKIKKYSIIGDGPDKKKLQDIINKENLSNKVKLIGWSDNIEEHLYDADIQIIPSVIEGFGLVAVEGMSTGLPVVASNIDSLKEIIDPSSISITLVNNIFSEIEWSEKIEGTITNLKNLGPKLVSNASRKQIERFSLSKMAENYLDLYYKS